MSDHRELQNRIQRANEVFEEVGDYDTDNEYLEEEARLEPPPYDEAPRPAPEVLPTYEECVE